MFIAVEGCEGAGKSSFVEALGHRFILEKQKVLLTREPGGSKLGESLRALLLDSSLEMTPYAELFLFLAGRAHHIDDTIVPALQDGYIVISDRFHDSTIVYQGIAENLGVDYVSQLCDSVTGAKPFYPDLTILLDIPVEEGLSRKKKQKVLDKFEGKPIEYHQKIRTGFLSLAHKQSHRYCILDARQPIECSIEELFSKELNSFVCEKR